MEIKQLFNNVEFYAPTHTYKHKSSGKVFTSVTQLISRYKNPFDPTGAIAKAVANKEGLTVEQVQAEWKRKSKEAIDLGNSIHTKYESHIKTKSESGDWIPQFEAALAKIGCSLEEDNIKYYPEILIYDEDNEIAGTVDLLIELPNGEHYLVDYKTNKALKHPSDEADYVKPMKSPFEELLDCNYNHYLLQLNGYRYMLQKKGINVAAMFIFHLNRDIKDIDIHPIPVSSLGESLITSETLNLFTGSNTSAAPIVLPTTKEKKKDSVEILDNLIEIALKAGEVNRYEATLIKKYVRFLKTERNGN